MRIIFKILLLLGLVNLRLSADNKIQPQNTYGDQNINNENLLKIQIDE